MSIFLSVIIPCYNEEENLKRNVLVEVKDYLSKKDFSWEVIISDDGSTDKSRDLIRKHIQGWGNYRLLENKHGGKPLALRYGIDKAKGKFILFTDMDQSTPIDQLDKLIKHLKTYSVVIGSRGLQRKNFPFYRKIGSVAFVYLRKMFILSEVNDTQCGFKLFERNLIKNAFSRLEFFKRKSRTKGWQVTSYDVELLHITKKLGAKIKEVVVEWHDKDVSTSKGGGLMRYLRESTEMFTQIIRVKSNDFRGVYN